MEMCIEWVNTGHNFYLLTRDGSIVGQLILDTEDLNELYIDLISVLKSEYGLGGASMLMKYAKGIARKLRRKSMSLAVDKNNLRAISFYGNLGFSLVKKIGRNALLYSQEIAPI
jgi:ribosomal protein S18 acetylase RimI-like enzyme